MHILLILMALVNGAPHQAKVPMETIEQCTAEATKFLNYAITDKHAQKAMAVCQIEVPESNPNARYIADRLSARRRIPELMPRACGFHDAAHAHLADRPDLNHWAHDLREGSGLPCCDGSDAEPIIDADWRAGPNGHYQVRIGEEWIDVPESAVVPGPNKYGRALVWGYPRLGDGENRFVVRCFMPAGGV